jgi:hypothetical protein
MAVISNTLNSITATQRCFVFGFWCFFFFSWLRGLIREKVGGVATAFVCLSISPGSLVVETFGEICYSTVHIR